MQRHGNAPKICGIFPCAMQHWLWQSHCTVVLAANLMVEHFSLELDEANQIEMYQSNHQKKGCYFYIFMYTMIRMIVVAIERVA